MPSQTNKLSRQMELGQCMHACILPKSIQKITIQFSILLLYTIVIQSRLPKNLSPPINRPICPPPLLPLSGKTFFSLCLSSASSPSQNPMSSNYFLTSKLRSKTPTPTYLLLGNRTIRYVASTELNARLVRSKKSSSRINI